MDIGCQSENSPKALFFRISHLKSWETIFDLNHHLTLTECLQLSKIILKVPLKVPGDLVKIWACDTNFGCGVTIITLLMYIVVIDIIFDEGCNATYREFWTGNSETANNN